MLKWCKALLSYVEFKFWRHFDRETVYYSMYFTMPCAELKFVVLQCRARAASHPIRTFKGRSHMRCSLLRAAALRWYKRFVFLLRCRWRQQRAAYVWTAPYCVYCFLAPYFLLVMRLLSEFIVVNEYCHCHTVAISQTTKLTDNGDKVVNKQLFYWWMNTSTLV